MKKIIFVVGFSLLTGFLQAESPILVDSRTGKYLGILSKDRYHSDSVSNPYGNYGSKYSADSINNPYGNYGSKYSNDSPHNPYATNPPVIISPRGDLNYPSGRLSD